MKTVEVEDKVVPEHTPRQEHTYCIGTSLPEGYPHPVYTYYLRGKKCTRVYTVVYPPVHNSVHTCTHLRSKYVLSHPTHSSPTRRIARENGPIQVYREDRHRGYLQAIVFYMYLRTALAQSIPNSTELRQRPKGEMAEWSIVAVSKAVELQGSGGSNPSLSAKERVQITSDLHPFYFIKEETSLRCEERKTPFTSQLTSTRKWIR